MTTKPQNTPGRITERFPISPRGWILCDPVHAQVRFDYQGRTLLGDVREVYFDGTTGVQRLRVHHFNGDRWPVDPPPRSVEVLVREYERGEK